MKRHQCPLSSRRECEHLLETTHAAPVSWYTTTGLWAKLAKSTGSRLVSLLTVNQWILMSSQNLNWIVLLKQFFFAQPTMCVIYTNELSSITGTPDVGSGSRPVLFQSTGQVLGIWQPIGLWWWKTNHWSREASIAKCVCDWSCAEPNRHPADLSLLWLQISGVQKWRWVTVPFGLILGKRSGSLWAWALCLQGKFWRANGRRIPQDIKLRRTFVLDRCSSSLPPQHTLESRGSGWCSWRLVPRAHVPETHESAKGCEELCQRSHTDRNWQIDATQDTCLFLWGEGNFQSSRYSWRCNIVRTEEVVAKLRGCQCAALPFFVPCVQRVQ